MIDDKTKCYSNLKKSTVEPDPDNNGIIRVFNYFLKATALEWNACKVRGVLTNGIESDIYDDGYQTLINAGKANLTNDTYSFTTNELISRVASNIPRLPNITIPELLVRCYGETTLENYIDYIIGKSNSYIDK